MKLININSNLTKGVEYLLTAEEEISVLANNTTSLGTINIPPNSVCTLTVRVNNRAYNPTFKLGLTGDLVNPHNVFWGESHVNATLYDTFASTITIPNGLSTEAPLYVVINSNIDMGVCYVIVTGIIAPIL